MDSTCRRVCSPTLHAASSGRLVMPPRHAASPRHLAMPLASPPRLAASPRRRTMLPRLGDAKSDGPLSCLPVGHCASAIRPAMGHRGKPGGMCNGVKRGRLTRRRAYKAGRSRRHGLAHSPRQGLGSERHSHRHPHRHPHQAGSSLATASGVPSQAGIPFPSAAPGPAAAHPIARSAPICGFGASPWAVPRTGRLIDDGGQIKRMTFPRCRPRHLCRRTPLYRPNLIQQRSQTAAASTRQPLHGGFDTAASTRRPLHGDALPAASPGRPETRPTPHDARASLSSSSATPPTHSGDGLSEPCSRRTSARAAARAPPVTA